MLSAAYAYIRIQRLPRDGRASKRKGGKKKKKKQKEKKPREKKAMGIELLRWLPVPGTVSAHLLCYETRRRENERNNCYLGSLSSPTFLPFCMDVVGNLVGRQTPPAFYKLVRSPHALGPKGGPYNKELQVARVAVLKQKLF